ncbi:AtpZ/AtpI family protein [Patescibacteria group bacterium]
MESNNNKSTFWQALNIAWEMGYTIVVPLVLLALGGRLLDKQLNTSPWLLLTGIIVSLVISSIGLVWKFNKIINRINKEIKKDKDK